MKRLLFSCALIFPILPAASGQISSLSGKVAMADGGPLPDRIAIQRDCGGAPVTAAFTDRKGQFTVRWNQTDGLTGDASGARSGGSPRGPMGNGVEQASTVGSIINAEGATMAGCQLRATAPGYRSDLTPLEGLRAFNENYDVGTIVLYRLGKASGPVSATSVNAPPAAIKAFDKGLESRSKGKNADAEKDFEKAVGLYPNYADAWLAIGKLRLQRNAQDSAVDAFQKAADADDALVEAHLQLGMIAVGKKQWPDAAKQLDTVLRLDPVHFPDAWYNDAVADYNLKNYDGAEKSVRELMRLDPQRRNGQAGFLLGVVLAGKNDFNGATEELRAYIKSSPDAPDVPQAKALLAQIEKLQTPQRP